LSVARKAAQMLREKGVAVMLTRSDDTFIALNERAAIANRAGATLFVSIHADSAPDASVHGFSAYVARSPSQQSVTAARAILRRLGGTTGAVDRGLKMADYRVLVRTTCPSVLVELGYLSNGFEAVKLADAGYQARLADAIAQGVSDFLSAGR
ncbi:MAG: N-acetylmuramoyl-L-alanine amidase, partial [Phycisphaerae bacterium]|nr:N-acetylmuramoyl-L-alanine amidase [Phycisphaerae bacterium]